jgi:two-component system sensor histidine kinase PilS (NtrC family)
MNAVIHDVLRLYRKEQPNPEVIALKTWLDNFNAHFSRDNGLAQDWAVISVAPADTTINMDANHLRQVLWNLCSNALKYGRDGDGRPALTLTGGRAPESLVAYLDVTDRGPGIGPELQAQLFEPFVTSSAQGTGLGLFIARELCHANGGDLSYTQGPQGGSSFRIQFPLALSGQAPSTAAPAHGREPRLQTSVAKRQPAAERAVTDATRAALEQPAPPSPTAASPESS